MKMSSSIIMPYTVFNIQPTHDLKLNGAFTLQRRQNIFHPCTHSLSLETGENCAMMVLENEQRRRKKVVNISTLCK